MIASQTSTANQHFPVMLKEVVKICSPEKGGNFIDCTFGGGSYSEELLKYPKTNIIALDRDSFVKTKAEKISKNFPKRFTFFNEKFSNLNNILDKNFKADGIIFDLGLSNFQIKDLKRGFSFKSENEIDMNMGLGNTSGEKVLNELDEKNLKDILKIFGEEKEASKIVKNIIKERKNKKILKVSELVKIISSSKKRDFKKKINVCTKTFQALRIFVNKEISELIGGIILATKFLKTGGKIIVVSFHSIEDKIVKYYFSSYSKNQTKPSRYLPDAKVKNQIFFENYKNLVLRANEFEVKENPPSRSAKLRYAIRSNSNFIYPKELKNRFKKYLDLERLND